MNVFSRGQTELIAMMPTRQINSGNRDDTVLFDLARRQDFIGLAQNDFASIRSIKAVIDLELPKALDEFYEQVRKTDETRKFFPSEGVIEHAKSAQREHWKSISSASFDQSYAEKVNAIGKVHAKIGLEPRWYIGGYGVVMGHLIHAIIKDMAPKRRGMARKRQDDYVERVSGVISSLVKAVFLEMDLTISVYLDEADRARQKARTEAVQKEREFVSSRFGAAVTKIADGNLADEMRDSLPDSYIPLRNDLNAAILSLRETLHVASTTIGTIDASANEIQSAITDMKERTEKQADSVGRTAAAIEEITATVSSTAERVSDANAFIANCQTITEQFGVMTRNAKEVMAGIAKSSEAIGEITQVMESIAAQTNILALNAAVEAARAGNSGRGFTVLAQEIRSLAGRAGDASKEVRELIKDSNARVSAGVRIMDDAGEAIDTIISSVAEVSDHLQAIDTATTEQAAAFRDVNNAISIIDQGTRKNTAMVEGTSKAVVRMVDEAGHLQEILSGFRLRG